MFNPGPADDFGHGGTKQRTAWSGEGQEQVPAPPGNQEGGEDVCPGVWHQEAPLWHRCLEAFVQGDGQVPGGSIVPHAHASLRDGTPSSGHPRFQVPHAGTDNLRWENQPPIECLPGAGHVLGDALASWKLKFLRGVSETPLRVHGDRAPEKHDFQF